MKVSRRQLAGMLAVPLAAQEAPKPATAEADLEAVRKQIRDNAEDLRKRRVPTSLEPSFAFRP